jgi:hypothetical protein
MWKFALFATGGSIYQVISVWHLYPCAIASGCQELLGAVATSCCNSGVANGAATLLALQDQRQRMAL